MEVGAAHPPQSLLRRPTVRNAPPRVIQPAANQWHVRMAQQRRLEREHISCSNELTTDMIGINSEVKLRNYLETALGRKQRETLVDKCCDRR